MLERERNQLTETESWRKRQEDEMKSEEERALAAKQRSSAVKNAKEYMASERELQATRKSAQERQEEVGEARRGGRDGAQVDRAARGGLCRAQGARQPARRRRPPRRSPSSTRRSARSASFARWRPARVRPDVLKKYSAIRMRRGLAMAPVKNGTCQGCNMNIPPQVFNQLQRGDSIELCGNCNRIIYWDKLLENPDGTPAEPKEKPEA